MTIVLIQFNPLYYQLCSYYSYSYVNLPSLRLFSVEDYCFEQLPSLYLESKTSILD